MSETAGWGNPGWLPERIARRAVLDDAREAREDREAKAERERYAEERHNRAVAEYIAGCQARGDQFDHLALARGELPGHSITDVLTAAAAAAALDDRRGASRMHRDGYGDPEPLHVEFVGDPVIHAASPVKRSIINRSRHWREWQERRAAAEAAQRAVEAGFDHGLVDGVTLRARDSGPVTVVSPSRRGDEGYQGIRTRDGGHVTGIW